MAFAVTYGLEGGARGPVSAISKEDITLLPVSITFGGADTYVTGGLLVVLPPEVDELLLVDVILTKAHDGTRRWEWNGSRTDPRLVAYDAFAVEEFNGTAIAGVGLRAILVLK